MISRERLGYTRYREKNEVFEKFKMFQSSIERMTETKVEALRTDQGLEFQNKDFEGYLTKQGIKIERTSTYTPQQNGIAERFNRSILEKVRAMLFDSGMSAGHWAEALLAATHIYNRVGHSSIENMTPNEKFSGCKPSVKHLRIYGARAYLVLAKQVRKNKLSPLIKLGYLVGYAVKTKGYRIWLPDENRVEESVHVKFDESITYKIDKIAKNQNSKSANERLRSEERNNFYSDQDFENEIETVNRSDKSENENKYDSDIEIVEFHTPEKQAENSERSRQSVNDDETYRRQFVN